MLGMTTGELPVESAASELLACQLNMDILNSVAMNEPGRNIAVMTASAFMAELSLLAETAMRAARRLSSCAILFWSCKGQFNLLA